MLQSPSMATLIPAVVLFSAVLLLKIREEPGLEKRFGTAYLEYKRRTPLLIPRPPLLLAFLESQFLSRGGVRNVGNRSPSFLVFTSVGIAVFSLYILSVMTFSLPNIAVQPFGKQLLLFSFAGICVFGVVAGLSPSKLSKLPFFGNSRDSGNRKTLNRDKSPMHLRGHHPICGRFSSHVLSLRGRTYCAGCIGLVAGALVSLVGCLVYLLTGFDGGAAFFKLGVAFILCGLLQHSLLDFDSAVLHCLLNILFAVGTFFVLIGLIGINNNPSVGVYFLLLTVNLMTTRIILSRLVHRKTCANCADRCTAAFV